MWLFDTNDYRIMHVFFDDYSMVHWTPIFPIIQKEKTKCEYPDHNLHTLYESLFEIFDAYSIIVR